MTDACRIDVHELERFCVEVLTRAGLSAADAQTTAVALVTPDAMGVFTHGTKLLAGYLNKLFGGGYRPQAAPHVQREGAAWAIIDGDGGLGQIACSLAVNIGVTKARNSGIAYVGIRNTGHIGAAGHYAAMAARQGCLAMVTGNDIPTVAAPGSRTAVLGSNPIAYAVPVADGDPILLDMATSSVAGGKVYAAHQRGEPIPATWLIGPDGLPTCDGSLYPQQAALAPMSGFKGYGIALWCEILSGALPGGAVMGQMGSWIFDEPSRPSWHNASLIVIDYRAMVPPELFESRLQTIIDNIHAAPTIEGISQVLLPGEREWRNYWRAKAEGIVMPPDVVAKLSEAACYVDLSLPWPRSAA